MGASSLREANGIAPMGRSYEFGGRGWGGHGVYAEPGEGAIAPMLFMSKGIAPMGRSYGFGGRGWGGHGVYAGPRGGAIAPMLVMSMGRSYARPETRR